MGGKHWWETVGPNGLPRFYVFLSPIASIARRHYDVMPEGWPRVPAVTSRNYAQRVAPKQLHHINVVELKPDAADLPRGHRSPQVKRVLLRTKPVRRMEAAGLFTFERAERVVEKLNTMSLSLMAVEATEKGGVKKLFDKLWQEDVVNNPD